MKKIYAECKDDTDKIILVAMLISSAFLSVIPSLFVVLLLKNYVSESTYNISKAFLNFELLLLIIMLLCAIPIIGWLLGLVLAPIMVLLNIIVILIDLYAIVNKSELHIPVWFELI